MSIKKYRLNDQNFMLQVEFVLRFSYHWSTGETTASITVKKTGLYSVTGTNRRGCEKLAIINVEEEPFLLIKFTITPTTINNKDNTIECSISPQDNMSYLWDLGDNTTDTRTTFTHLYPLNSETASFTVRLTAINSVTGCVNSSASRVITVEPFVPNVFSPNGDGINDYFMPNYDMQVFDRNGILLYQGNKDSKGWDGTYKGKNVDTDTYFYVLHYSNANQQIVTKKGYVTLIR
jgi:gliding motility-associated-like protein